MKPFIRSRRNNKKLFDNITLGDVQSRNQAQSSYTNALNHDENDEKNEVRNQQKITEPSASQQVAKSTNVFNQYQKFQQRPIDKSQNLIVEPDKQQIIAEKTKEQKTRIVYIDDENFRKSFQQHNLNYADQNISSQEEKQNQNYPYQQNQFQEKYVEKSTKRKLLDTQNQLQNDSTLISYGSQILIKQKKIKLNLTPVRVDKSCTEKSQNQEKLQDKYLAITEPYSPNIFKKKNIHNKYIDFASKEISQGYKLKLVIKRTSKYMGWNVNYQARFQSDDRYLMSAFKMSHSHMMTHHISINQNSSEENSQQYLGKIKSNFMHNVINIFSPGYKPEQSYKDPANCRQILATIKFTSDAVYQSSLPKNIKVYVLNQYCQYTQLQGYKKNDEINLQDLYQYQSNKDKISVYRNRRPVWKQELKCFVLDFHGRLKVPSVKNFILEIDNPKSLKETQEVLLFGKLQQDKYLLDISSPLSPRVAFGIVLTICSTS